MSDLELAELAGPAGWALWEFCLSLPPREGSSVFSKKPSTLAARKEPLKSPRVRLPAGHMDPLRRIGWGLGSCREKGKRVVCPEQEEWPCLGIARDSKEGETMPSMLAGVF